MFKARLIDRWHSEDPLADAAPNWTPYRYCFNNPVNLVDPDGMFEGDYYNEDGAYLGSDGKNDDKVYVVKKDSYFSTPDGSKSVIMNDGITELKNPDGTSFSHKKFLALAGTLYAESTPGSKNWKESAAIYCVLENRAKAIGITPYEIASNTSTYGVYGWDEKDKINSPLAPKDAVANAYKGLIAGIMESTDFSGGATYWHGKDFGMSNKLAYKSFYKVGFDFTSSSHDVWKLGDHKSGMSNWDYKYQSTASIGGTTFMKLTEEWKKAVRYNKPY